MAQIHDAAPVRFSVVIPAYNAAATLGRALESVCVQSLPAWEIIVVDDASSDDTAYLLTLAADRVKSIRLKQNMGPAYARNRGIEATTGDYIAFLDADDSWHPERLAILARCIAQKPDIDLLFHPYSLQEFQFDARSSIQSLRPFPFSGLLLHNVIATPCVVIRRSLNPRFDESMRFMEDYELWLRIAYRHKPYFLDLPLTRLGRPVLSRGGQSANRWQMRLGELRTYSRLIYLNPALGLLVPWLWAGSLIKHLIKSFR
jgi:teichuronic acid biosynthesis glycosyltransferase TuaG